MVKMVISQAYVKQFHTTGLVWAKTGGDAIMVARQPNKGEVVSIMIIAIIAIAIIVINNH